MPAIYVKEMKQYFHSMIGYVFLMILLLICGFLFTTGNLMSQNGDINTFFSSLFNILLFLIPMLTMRQFSEEYKLKTHQLLFTLPLSLESIVIGKFLATFSIIVIGLSITIIYVVILASLGSLALLTIFGNYLGVLLLISSVIALGLFISTLTENQIISAIVSYGVVLILWLVDSVIPYVGNPLFKKALNIFSLKSNYIEFSYGIFNLASILYFLSLTVLFLILTTASLETRRH